MLRIFISAVLLATALGVRQKTLPTSDVVSTPVYDMIESAMKGLQDSDSVEVLQKKVEKVNEIKSKNRVLFNNVLEKHGKVDSKKKLEYALRQTIKDNDMLGACTENDDCSTALFERIDANNDGNINADEFTEYIVDDGTDPSALREKRKAAAKVLRTLHTADVNNDDVISPQEFAQWREDIDFVDDSALSYEAFDIDKDGEVSKKEFARALLKLADSKESNVKQFKDLIQAGHELVGLAKAHSNLAESYRQTAKSNFEQRLNDVPQMNLDGALNMLQKANEDVLQINEMEKNVPTFKIKVEGKEFLLEGNQQKFYRSVGALTDMGFDAKKTIRAMVAAEGNEVGAKKLLCNSEEAEDVEVCDEPQEEDEQGSSFVERDEHEAESAEEQDRMDEAEERMNGPARTGSEIHLPALHKEVARFQRMKQDIMKQVIEKMSEPERKALLSKKGKTHLRQLMPKNAAGFAKGMQMRDSEEPSISDKKAAASSILNIAKVAAQPAVDIADLGLQMVLGPKDEFLGSLPDKVDNAITEYNKRMGI